MKITLAFLFLGICLALTNARSVAKGMTEAQGYSHGRMMALAMKKWADLQICQRCSDAERYCMEKAIMEDVCFVLKMMTNDMGCTMQQFFANTQTKFQLNIVIHSMDHNDMDTLTKYMRSNRLIDHFMQCVCGLMNVQLKASNVDMGGMLSSMNKIMGGRMNVALSLVGVGSGAPAGAAGAAGNLVDTATGPVAHLGNSVSHVANTATGIANTAAGAVARLGNSVSDVANAATGLLSGLFGKRS